MRLVLIRHGRPDEDDAARPHDPPLRSDGWAQARAVATALAGEGITRIVASPLRRARQTAEPLAESLGLGDGARYRSTETLRALGDKAWQRFLADPVRFVGGDPVRFHADVTAALDAMLAQGADDDHVAVFTHGLPINLVLSRALGLNGIVHFRPGYGSLTRLIAYGRAIGVVSVNESGHHLQAGQAA